MYCIQTLGSGVFIRLGGHQMEVGCLLLGGKRLGMGRRQASLCVPHPVWDATGAPPLCPPWRRCEPRSPSSPGSQAGCPPLPGGLSAGPGRGQDRARRWALEGRALPCPLSLFLCWESRAPRSRLFGSLAGLLLRGWCGL